MMGRIFYFGKYKGNPIINVIKLDSGYIRWCLENVKWFKLNSEEKKVFDEILTNEDKKRKEMAEFLSNLSRQVSYDDLSPEDFDCLGFVNCADDM